MKVDDLTFIGFDPGADDRTAVVRVSALAMVQLDAGSESLQALLPRFDQHVSSAGVLMIERRAHRRAAVRERRAARRAV